MTLALTSAASTTCWGVETSLCTFGEYRSMKGSTEGPPVGPVVPVVVPGVGASPELVTVCTGSRLVLGALPCPSPGPVGSSVDPVVVDEAAASDANCCWCSVALS